MRESIGGQFERAHPGAQYDFSRGSSRHAASTFDGSDVFRSVMIVHLPSSTVMLGSKPVVSPAYPEGFETRRVRPMREFIL